MYEVGKKVIAIKDQSNGNFFKRGDIKTVLGLMVCSCGSLKLDLGFTVPDGRLGSMCSCGEIWSGRIWWGNSESWAPLSDISTELRSTTVEEFLSETVEA